MNNDLFFKHPELPFAECRHSADSGRHYKPHMHKAFCVGAVDRGEVVLQVGETSKRLQPGNLCLINPETLHSCNPTEGCQRSYYMLFLDAAWCLQVQQSLWQVATFRPVNIDLLRDEALYYHYIDTVRSLPEKEDPLAKELGLAELAERIFLKACEPGAEKRDPPLHIERVKQQLGSDLDREISMSRIARKLQANPFTLLRQFKAATGITPHAYRLNCRIELAKTLMQQGQELSHVALECGFYDQSHFHRHFKAMTTVTPGEYQVSFVQRKTR